MGDWCSNYLDLGKRVGDDVLAGYVADVHGELGNEVEKIELSW
jgi:hypothetical protein